MATETTVPAANDAKNRPIKKRKVLIAAPSAIRYIRRNKLCGITTAETTLPKPFLLIEKVSFLEIISSPKIKRIMVFLQKATGINASILIPITPSENRSMTSPVAKAINIETTVSIFVGRHNTITGRIVSIMYGLKLK